MFFLGHLSFLSSDPISGVNSWFWLLILGPPFLCSFGGGGGRVVFSCLFLVFFWWLVLLGWISLNPQKKVTNIKNLGTKWKRKNNEEASERLFGNPLTICSGLSGPPGLEATLQVSPLRIVNWLRVVNCYRDHPCADVIFLAFEGIFPSLRRGQGIVKTGGVVKALQSNSLSFASSSTLGLSSFFFFSDYQRKKGGGGKLGGGGGGETYHNPPQERFWTPPTYDTFPRPVCSHPVISLEETCTDQPNPTFWGLQN